MQLREIPVQIGHNRTEIVRETTEETEGDEDKTTGTQLNWHDWWCYSAGQSLSKNWAAAELGIGLHAAQTIPLIKSK